MVKPSDYDSGGDSNGADDPSERRKFLRVDLPLKARFLTENSEEQACLIINISAGGAYMRTKHPPAFGQSIVLYVDQLGRFESKVIRSGANSFAVTYEKKRAKSARTADGLTQIVNRGARSHDRRKNPRIQHDAPARIHFEDGRVENCAILDISLTGASIEINPRPALGTRLILGRMTAKVVRRHEKGVGVVFTGAANRMDEVIDETSANETPSETGAAVASSFGKKGASA